VLDELEVFEDEVLLDDEVFRQKISETFFLHFLVEVLGDERDEDAKKQSEEEKILSMKCILISKPVFMEEKKR